MKSNKHSVYQLVLLTSLLFPAEKVRDIAEDYAEYLREQPEKPESPRQFCTAIIREGPGYRPKIKTILSVLAAAVLIFAGIRANFFVNAIVPLSFLAVGLPVVIWTTFGGSTAARYSPPFPHAARCVLLPFLAVTLPSAGFFLVFYAAISHPFLITPGMAWIITRGQWICSAIYLLLFFVFACLLWRRSIWYFCSMVQFLSGWCFLRGIYDLMTSMDVSLPFSLYRIFHYLIPPALGLCLSLAFALVIRSLTGKENTQWTDK